MAEEVSDAITWAMKDSETRRGNSNRTTIIGHSAGAQLCMMALIKRAQKIGSLKMSESLSQDDRKHSMPSAFLGILNLFHFSIPFYLISYCKSVLKHQLGFCL